MTTPAREPSNAELWAQPPTGASVPPAPQSAGLAVPQPEAVPVPAEAPHRQGRGVLALAITSLGVGIPVTAIASTVSGTGGLLVAWIGIVGVNAVYAWSQRKS